MPGRRIFTSSIEIVEPAAMSRMKKMDLRNASDSSSLSVGPNRTEPMESLALLASTTRL
jgi:hypothetical protein